MSSDRWLGELRLPRAKALLPVCSQSLSIPGKDWRARALSPTLPCEYSPDPGPTKDFSCHGVALLVLMSRLWCRVFPRWVLQAIAEDFVNSSYFCRPAGNC